MYVFKKRNNNKSLKIKILILCVLLIFIVSWIYRKITPIVNSAVSSYAKLYASRLIYDTVEKKLSEESIEYSDIVLISKDSSGKVTLVETDTIKLLRLKAAIVCDVLDSLSRLSELSLSIPLGNLMNSPFLSGRGPKIPFKLVPFGYFSSFVESSFSAAGINQTQHRLILNLCAEINVLIPGFKSSVSVPISLVIAETIIVGTTPDSFRGIIIGKENTPI